jgi:hypothetical protein
MDVDFSRVLQKYLDRTRTLIIKKPFPKTRSQHRYLTDAELGGYGAFVYNSAKEAIDKLDLSDLPVSPIDRIKQELADAGYKVGEITGRGTIIDYSGDEPILQGRSRQGNLNPGPPGHHHPIQQRRAMTRSSSTRPAPPACRCTPRRSSRISASAT